LYSLENYTFPDKPFMIALGTSHTCGDCDGPTYGPTSVKVTAYDMIANELELELVKIGLSGCKNEDLLQATNELAHHKALNDNCKLFMLEPRLGDRTVRIPVEAIIPDNYYIGGEDHNNTTEFNMPIMEDNDWNGYGMLEAWAPNPVNHNMATVQQVSVDKRSDKSSSHNFATTAYIDASSFYSHSPLDLFNSVTIIDSIRHIVEANNIKFRWQLVTGRCSDTDLAETLLGNHSTLFDTFVNMVEESINKTHTNAEQFICGCGHYNKEGHKLWYKNTIDHLR